jgi:hypothetical protein
VNSLEVEKEGGEGMRNDGMREELITGVERNTG